MSSKIEIFCFECGHPFLKWAGDVSRSKKINRPNFCVPDCRLKHIREGGKSEYYKKYVYPITKYCGKNRKGKCDEFSPFRKFITRTKSKSRKHYGESNLSVQYLKELWEHQRGRCAYSNITLLLPKTSNEYDIIRSMKKASLDRIDSNRGYVEGNVQFVCLSLNMAKKDFDDDEMKTFMSEIKNAEGSSAFENGGDAGYCPRVSNSNHS